MARVAWWMLSQRWRSMHRALNVRMTRATMTFCRGGDDLPPQSSLDMAAATELRAVKLT
jgi:hypothetical protein